MSQVCNIILLVSSVNQLTCYAIVCHWSIAFAIWQLQPNSVCAYICGVCSLFTVLNIYSLTYSKIYKSIPIWRMTIYYRQIFSIPCITGHAANMCRMLSVWCPCSCTAVEPHQLSVQFQMCGFFCNHPAYYGFWSVSLKESIWNMQWHIRVCHCAPASLRVFFYIYMYNVYHQYCLPGHLSSVWSCIRRSADYSANPDVDQYTACVDGLSSLYPVIIRVLVCY